MSWCSGLCPTSPGSVRVEAPRRAEAQARPKNKPQEGPYHRHWIPLSEVQSKAHQGRCTQRCWSRETREREGTLKTWTEQIRGRLYIPGLDLTTAEKGKILNLWRFLKMKKWKSELGRNQIHETENHFRYWLLMLKAWPFHITFYLKHVEICQKCRFETSLWWMYHSRTHKIVAQHRVQFK